MSDKAPAKKTPVKKAAKKTAPPAKKAAKKTAPAAKKVAKKTAPPAKKTAPVAKKADTSPKTAKSTKQFEDENVKVQLETFSGCSVKVHVEMAEKLIQESKEQAIKEVSKSISLPGFRKGKVPKNLIEKNYAGNIKEQKTQILLQKGLDAALKLADLRPLNYRNVQPKIEKLNENEVHFSYEFESYPEVPSINLDKIKLEKVALEEVTDEKIDEVIDVMRSYRAKWDVVEDRAIEMGDYADITVKDLENDQLLVDKKRVQIEKGKLSSWLIKVLVGMKKDEKKKGTSEFDPDLPSSDKKDFKKTKCEVEVHGIHTAELPPVDDAFAKAMGTQSVADLRTQVLLRLKQNAEVAQDNQQKALLDQALVEAVDFELPESLMKAEMETKTKLKLQGAKDKKELSAEEQNEVERDSITALKLFFILQKIANDKGIIVSEQELRDQLSQRISQLNLPKEFSTNTQYKNRLIQEMRMNTFIDLLTEKVKNSLLKEVAFV